MKLQSKYVILGILVLFMAFYFGGYYNGHKKANNASESIMGGLNNTLASYVVMIDDNKTYISRIEQENKTQKQAIKDGEIIRKELRALNIKHVNEISRLKLRIDTLLTDISHNGQIVHVDTVTINGKPTNAILLPFEFNKKDNWVTLKGKFDYNGKLDISLKLDSIGVDLWTAIDKKTKKTNTYLTTTNPYIGVINIKSQKFDAQKVKRYSAGLFFGYGVGKNGLTPVVAFGIGYTPIRW